MSKRTYRQYCGLAAALDVVGQRWALLIVRDLVPGPRRFTDLFDGLPGISTDLLADRLRSLEAAGAVQRCEVRHPVPASLYELTERGHELAHLAGGLARWGGPLLPDDADGHVQNARWNLTQRAARYRGGFPDGDVHILLDGQHELTLSFTGDRAQLSYGHTPVAPTLKVDASTAEMLALFSNPPESSRNLVGHLCADGEADLVHQLVECLG